jgi:hypothetical protein
MEFQGFFEVREGFLLGLTLTGDVNFKALRDVPISLTPNRCGKWTFHESIFAQAGGPTNPNES